MKDNRLANIIKAKMKMTHSRDGSDIGPLPSIESYTDYSTSYSIDLFWYDRNNNINIVKKHVKRILLEWKQYPQEQVDYIMNNFLKIEKTQGRDLDGSLHDLDGYNVDIQGKTDDLLK